jgi:hypothetical protein
MGVRIQCVRRAAELAWVARHPPPPSSAPRVGVVGKRPAPPESTSEFSTPSKIWARRSSVGLPVSSALMSFVDHTVAVVGFALSAGLALYIARPILRMRGAL